MGAITINVNQLTITINLIINNNTMLHATISKRHITGWYLSCPNPELCLNTRFTDAQRTTYNPQPECTSNNLQQKRRWQPQEPCSQHPKHNTLNTLNTLNKTLEKNRRLSFNSN